MGGGFDSVQMGQQRTKGPGAVVRLFSWSASGPEQRLQTQPGRYLGLPRLRTERLTSMFAESAAATIILVIMAKKPPFALVYADEVKQHLRAIETKYHSLIRTEVEAQLLFQPNAETRIRKPLKRPIAFGTDWELRLGPDNRFRVFYQVNAASREVRVLAVGVKDRNRLLIGEEEFEGRGISRGRPRVMDEKLLITYGFPAIGGLLALLFLFLALRAGRRQRLVSDLPTSKTTGVFIGLVELKGTAEAEQPLISFLAEQSCVYYQWQVDEQWSRVVTETYTDSEGRTQTRTRIESGSTTVAQGGDQIPFYLQDDCGIIRIQPEKAKVEPRDDLRLLVWARRESLLRQGPGRRHRQFHLQPPIHRACDSLAHPTLCGRSGSRT